MGSHHLHHQRRTARTTMMPIRRRAQPEQHARSQRHKCARQSRPNRQAVFRGFMAPSKDWHIPSWELDEYGVLLAFGLVVVLQFRPDSHCPDAYYRIRLRVKGVLSAEDFQPQDILCEITSPTSERLLDGKAHNSAVPWRSSRQFA